jgi:uncharacterized membrane protein
MRQKPPTSGLIHYRERQMLRLLDEFGQIGQRAAKTALAKVRDGTIDVASASLATEHIERAMNLTIALRERIEQQAAARKAPKRRVSVGLPRRDKAG